MRHQEKVTCLSADLLEQRAATRFREAELPPGEARQQALKNAAQLQACTKRFSRASFAESA